MGEKSNGFRFWRGSQTEGDCMEDLDINGRISEKDDRVVWGGHTCPKVGINSGLF
jgi:hypothetical protein